MDYRLLLAYLSIVELRLDVERLHDLELEKFPEVELLSVWCRIGDFADKDVGAQLLHLHDTPLLNATCSS